MDIVFGSEDLRQQIIFQADPETIYHLTETNDLFRKQLESPFILEQLGKKFGWYLKTFDDFVDAYHSSFLTPDVHKYMDYETSMKWALKVGNLEVADELFEFLRFHNGLNKPFRLKIERFGLAGDERVMKWVHHKLESYDHRPYGSFGLGIIVRKGDIEGLNAQLRGELELGRRSWWNLMREAFASGSLEMVDRILYGLPADIGLWKDNDGTVQYDNDLSNQDQNAWNELMYEAIGSREPSMINFLLKLGKSYGIAWDRPSNLMAQGAAKNKDPKILDEYLFPYIATLDNNSMSKIYAIINVLVEEYDPNNLEIMKKILESIKDKVNSQIIVYGIIQPIVDAGNLNMLRYITNYYNVSARQLDIIYQYITQKNEDSEISGIGIPDEFNPLETGESEQVITRSRRVITRNSAIVKYAIPDHPGVFEWFRSRSHSFRLYQIDIIGMSVTNDSYGLRQALLSYRVDPSNDGVECVVEAARVNAFVIVEMLLDDYRIGCLHFDEEEVEILQSIKSHDFRSIILNDVRFRETPSPLLEIHHNKMFTSEPPYLERYRLMANNPKTQAVALRIKNHYLSSNNQLAAKLNDFQVPFIPCFDHLACSILLSPEPDQYRSNYEDIDLEGILTNGTYKYVTQVFHYMKEKGTLKNIL